MNPLKHTGSWTYNFLSTLKSSACCPHCIYGSQRFSQYRMIGTLHNVEAFNIKVEKQLVLYKARSKF
jgi:hypothetical protein